MNLARPQALKHCGKCHKKIVGFWQEDNGISYHPQCFQCDQCHLPLGKAGRFVRSGNNIYCRACQNATVAKKGYRKELPSQSKHKPLDDTKQPSPSPPHYVHNNDHNNNIQLSNHQQQNVFSQPMALTTDIDTIYHHSAPMIRSTEELCTVYNPPVGGFEIAHKVSLGSDDDGHKNEDNLQRNVTHHPSHLSASVKNNEPHHVQMNSSLMKEVHSHSPQKECIQTNAAPMKVTVTGDDVTGNIDHKMHNAPYRIQNKSFGGFDKKHNAIDGAGGRLHSYSTNVSASDTIAPQQHTFPQTLTAADKNTARLQEQHSVAPHVCNKSFGGFESKLSFEVKRVHSHSYSANNIDDDDTSACVVDENNNAASWIPPPPPTAHDNITKNSDIPPPPTAHDKDTHNNDIPPPPPPPLVQEHNTADEQREESVTKSASVKIFEEVYEEPTDPNNVYRAPEPVKKEKPKKKKFRLFR